eukprot:gene10415-2942_t
MSEKTTPSKMNEIFDDLSPMHPELFNLFDDQEECQIPESTPKISTIFKVSTLFTVSSSPTKDTSKKCISLPSVVSRKTHQKKNNCRVSQKKNYSLDKTRSHLPKRCGEPKAVAKKHIFRTMYRKSAYCPCGNTVQYFFHGKWTRSSNVTKLSQSNAQPQRVRKNKTMKKK